MIEIKTYSKPKKTGGSGGSSSSTKYISGVISEAEHAGRADKAKRAEVADQANYAGTAASAQNAAYASEAGSLREDAEILQQYLSLKDTVDPQVVKGQVKFEQLLQLLQGFSLGNICGFDGSGNGIISSVASGEFNSASQQGFGIKPDDNGRYSLSITDLIVWGKAVFNELEIRKLSYAGGNVYLSGAGSKLVKVVPVIYNRETGECTASTDEECNGWKCYILADDGTTATQNWWMVNDQARCQTFNIKPGAYDNASNKEYWRCVVAVSSKSEFIVNDEGDSLYGDKKFDWIILSKTNCLTGSDIPAEGDAIVLDGHQVQTGDEGSISRTNVLMLETTGADTPRIVGYRGITDFTHEGKDVFVISPSNVTISSSVFKFKTVSGQTITIINDRGAYDPAVDYYYYDRVIYDNAYWTLIYSGDKQPVKGITPTEEAVNGIVYWRKDLSGGIKGDDAVSYSIQFSERITTISSVETKVLDVRFIKSVGQQITSGSIKDIDFNGACVVYIDGVMNDKMTDRLNSGQTYLDIYHAFADEIKGKKGLSVELRNSDHIVVASNTFSFAESGEGVVMAYKNAPSRPEPPVTEDLSLLTNGWSRTPQKGGSYEKVSNVSYGNYTVGATESGYSTSEWSEVSDSGETWRKSPAGLSTNSGWALMKVSFTANVDNADVKVVIKAYSEAGCDFIQVHDIDREITGSTSLRKNGVVYTSGNGVEDTYNFTSVGAGQHFFYVSYCKDVSLNSNGDYGLFRFDLSDNLVSMPSTVWMSQAILKDGKAVLPWSTPVQITGDDAYRVEVSPSTLVFDTNENGLVDSATLSGKYATVTVYKGNQKISTDNLSLPSNYETKKYTNVDGRISNVNGEARITISSIGTETISEDVTVSKSSGQISFPIDVFGERNTLMWATVNVQVNVAKFTGSVVVNNKRYESKFTEISTKFGQDLADAESRITQTAREISLSVSEKTIGRRNLLVGSAARRQGEGWTFMSGGYYNGLPCDSIEINSGHEGVNAIHCRTKQAGTNSYYLCGFRWIGTYSQQGNIKLKKGKSYTLSFWAKAYNSGYVNFVSELIWQGSATDNSRPAGYTGPKGFSTTQQATKNNTWTQFKVNIEVPSSASYEYVEVNIFARATNYTLQDAYICKPMLEEGDYNGWTLSEQDYDYVGGNLLDNTRTLTVGGNLNDVGGSTIISQGYGYDSAVAHADNSSGSSYKEILRWRTTSGGNMSFQKGKDYLLSFLASGSGRMTCYLYCSANNTSSIYSENNQGNVTNNAADGASNFTLSSGWKRYWVHFRVLTDSPLPTDILMRAVIGTNVYVAQPKLEEGATMTEYTERKSDLVDKASLKAAGIVVGSESVTLYGNQVHIKKNKTDADDTVLIDNETGKVSAGLIDADKVVAAGIQAKEIDAKNATISNLNVNNIKLTGSYRSPFSQAAAGKDMSYSDNVFLQGNNEWVNSYTLKWDATQSGRLIRFANYSWSGNATSGYGKIKAPDGSHFFFVNGEKRSQLYISEQEMVELLGIGDKTSFIGWAVVNRIHLNNYLNGMNVPILMMGKVETSKKLSGNGYFVSSNVRSFRGFGDYNGEDSTVAIEASRVGTGTYRLLLQPEFAKYLYNTDIVVQVTGIGNSLEDGNNPSSPIKATFNGIHFGSYPKYEGSYIEIWTSDDNTKNEGSFFIEVKCMNFFGSNS